jgi:hypothetical protein
MFAMDDTLMLAQVKGGRHDGGDFSLAYRETIKDHPHVRTLLVDRGNHSGLLYLSDPHWFARVTMTFLKHWQGRDDAEVRIAAPPLDVLAEGNLEGQMARYRVAARNHGALSVGPVELHVQLPAGARVESCWVGFEGLGRCETKGERVRWTLPRLPGGKTTAGPFQLAVNVARVKPGAFEARAWIAIVEERPDAPEELEPAAIPQNVVLTKP